MRGSGGRRQEMEVSVNHPIRTLAARTFTQQIVPFVMCVWMYTSCGLHAPPFVYAHTCAYRTYSSTIAPEEAAKFSQVEWWAEDSWMMKSLNSMNSLRVPLIKNSLLQLPLDAPPTSCHTPSPLHGYSILDVGCGAGFLSEVGDTLVQ